MLWNKLKKEKQRNLKNDKNNSHLILLFFVLEKNDKKWIWYKNHEPIKSEKWVK